ncbi:MULTISPECIES: SusC/RagA family TonB-linked outer membrane protein [Flavobacterium]|uniref:SusC/RagA family TonB-linked outer membrane protein n=3 Tax=Flavobacterium TaxID=237 RepID=A0ABR7J878_9FLAO|nr:MULTISPECIES: SusC/RagA family TonB-linked outer membrane protein [Flavobacterium]MBC5841705.1 SusC/RagA family TonB-linked outer membrane protein [Flavobacterium kayseriense]MBC5848234.1 SusC/RagA family TonB-linked outer membrane protein [Flavobacterium kayseriense]MBC5864311.1 SusC/RagA family TonB-linked outer membrane protein [Flavobacterium turcicum]NHL02915.1 SusC/RagA family TonB-linked outer membrane protein [Flavobacterium turcicum]
MKKKSFLKFWTTTQLSKLYCILFLCFITGLNAQTRSIKGKITDDTSTVPGVTIKVNNKPTTAFSDENGNYTILAAANDVLVFSYLGYKTIQIVVANQVTINVKLTEDATTLKEIVINAGYYSIKEKEQTGSIARMTAKDIDKQPVTNVLAAMQGRMAGVNIIQDGGTPGGGFQIKIRGRNSIRLDGNEPLYIIDGVPYSNESIGSTNTSTALPSQASPLNSINPNDIESIEVLKDADATAIYGSRGANGVVLITRKKGKSGKTNISVTASTAVGTATKFVDLMNTEEYLSMRKQAFINDGIPISDTDYDVNGAWDQTRYTNWQKELLGGSATINDLRTSISGGSETTQFLISGNYRTEGTVLPGDFRYIKGGILSSINHTSLDKKFKISFSGNYTAQDNLQAATDLTLTARYLAPNAPALYDSNGNLNWENDTFENPLAPLNSTYRANTNDLVANSVLSYELIPGLEIKSNFGFTDLKTKEVRTIPSTIYNPVYEVGSDNSLLYLNHTSRQSWIIEPQIRGFKTFGNHKFDVLLGMTSQQQRTERLFQSGIGFANNNLINNLASAITKNTTNSDIFLYRYQAFFGRVNYSYNEKYFLNFTGRRDGSSRFGPGKQYANFGAIGAAWIFSKEKFNPENSKMSFGKLRFSYGTTGNDQIGDYQFYDTYGTTGANYQGIIGLQPTRLYNADFGWETNRKLELALETGFFKDRIFSTLALYKNRSSDQLVGIPMPATTGFLSLNANLDATVENSGFEFSVRTLNIDSNSFKWSTNFNVAVAKNKLLSFPNLSGSTFANRYVIGQSIDIVKLYQSKGVNPQTGLYDFVDLNGDGSITAGDKQISKDLSPKYFGGIQNQLDYKNWQLDFLFQFVKRDNYDYISNVPGGGQVNQSNTSGDAWQQIGDQSSSQLHTTGLNGAAVSAYYRYIESDAVITDGSFIRLKNISLSYDIPLQATTNVKCKLFIQCQNLLTFTSYKAGDPEFKFSGFLPPLKVISGGMTLNF